VKKRQSKKLKKKNPTRYMEVFVNGVKLKRGKEFRCSMKKGQVTILGDPLVKDEDVLTVVYQLGGVKNETATVL
jgi:NAD(P)H-hydrate repair Nnr-like enzyme with NAD(P)H-hydrate dehydratase domain